MGKMELKMKLEFKMSYLREFRGWIRFFEIIITFTSLLPLLYPFVPFSTHLEDFFNMLYQSTGTSVIIECIMLQIYANDNMSSWFQLNLGNSRKTEKIDFSMNNSRPRSLNNTNVLWFLLLQSCSGLISERNNGWDEEIAWEVNIL